MKITKFLYNFSPVVRRLASEVDSIIEILSAISFGKPYHRFLEKDKAIALEMTVAN